MSQIDDDIALLSKRPVSAAAIDRLEEIVCKDDQCGKIECIALKCALAAYWETAEQ